MKTTQTKPTKKTTTKPTPPGMVKLPVRLVRLAIQVEDTNQNIKELDAIRYATLASKNRFTTALAPMVVKFEMCAIARVHTITHDETKK